MHTTTSSHKSVHTSKSVPPSGYPYAPPASSCAPSHVAQPSSVHKSKGGYTAKVDKHKLPGKHKRTAARVARSRPNSTLSATATPFIPQFQQVSKLPSVSSPPSVKRKQKKILSVFIKGLNYLEPWTMKTTFMTMMFK